MIGGYFGNRSVDGLTALSGSIPAGSIFQTAIASGQIGGNIMASGGLQSGAIGSGQIYTNHMASGATSTATKVVAPVQSGINFQLITEEMISGVRAIQISQSGGIRIAMASVSGRMPANGIVIENVLSGIGATVITQGIFQLISGMANYINYIGKPVFVGRSGQLVITSGSFNSGGLDLSAGADFVQRMGIAVNSGALLLNISPDFSQTQTIGITNILDAANRNIGI